VLDGYIIIDPEMLHTLNIAQTWGSLENWMAITPDLEPLVCDVGLQRRQDLRGRWTDHVTAYEWAFENLFSRCSTHVVGNMCINFPHHPAYDTSIRDFLVHNKAFTFDLSASYRQRREYRLMDKIYAGLEFPSGVWGWHNTRDHEHYAVGRAARQSIYTICALGCPNLSVHGGFQLKTASPLRHKPSLRKNLRAEKEKIYIAFMMSDGDSLWAMYSRQMYSWGTEERGTFPMSWGFLPILIDIAPAMYSYYVDNMKTNDYMVAGPSGAGYTYPHMYPDPRKFLRYTKHYMQKCGLEIVNITNWNEYTNWQEVDLPDFNPMLFEELDNCIGYVRGMGESAFEPHYNFADKPYLFCGEGLHYPDNDDVATIKNFIEANPNRPLFIYCLNNVAVSIDRIKAVIAGLQDYDIDYVRLDDFMRLIQDAYKQGLISEDLYPSRDGNERILTSEAPMQWANTKAAIERLIPIIRAETNQDALSEMNSEEAGLALGQRITDDDKADILAFALCENMFLLVKNVLNLRGMYVNQKTESVLKFMDYYGDWKGVDSLHTLTALWQNWDESKVDWEEIVCVGRDFLYVFEEVDKMFGSA
ncbi:MAG: hypothetical protein ABIH23_27480, partial [bacterium]